MACRASEKRRRRRLAGLALGSLAWAAAVDHAAGAASYTAKRVRYSANVDLPAPPPPTAEIPIRYDANESAFTELTGPSERFLVDIELTSSIVDDGGATTFTRVYPLALDLRSSEISVLGSTACDNLDIEADCVEEIKYLFCSTTTCKKIPCTQHSGSLVAAVIHNVNEHVVATKVRVITKSSKGKSYWGPSLGAYGLSPYVAAFGDGAISSFIDVLSVKADKVPPDYVGFGIDISGPGGGSLHLNGIPPQIAQQVVWSQPPPYSVPVCYLAWSDPISPPAASASFYAVLYDLSFGGVKLLGGITNSYTFAPDLFEQCLVLPGTIFRVLQSWLPVTCHPTVVFDSDTLNPNPTALPCNITDDADLEQMKRGALTFRLDDDGEKIPIPLSDLIFDYPDGKKGLCVKSTGLSASPTTIRHLLSPLDTTVVADTATPLGLQEIVFGSRAMRNVYMAFDYRTGRTGLSPKRNVSEFDTSLGAGIPQKKCSGLQVYYEPSNTCLGPVCDVYLFSRLNDARDQCEFISVYRYTIVILGVIIIAGELTYTAIYASLVQKALASLS